ncbi:MAG: SDR family oxidoreductase [Bacteroidales bacterium]
MGSKILVTGATGTIGSFVVENLQKANADFIALVRSEEKAKSLNDKGILTVIGDLEDIESLRNAMSGIDKLFLLSVTSPESPKLQGNAVKVAKEKGIKHIVKISARGANPDATFNIGRFHGETEEDIRQSGIPFTFVQPHSFLQNLLFEAGTIKNENAIYASMADGKIPMVDARDIAAVASKALMETGHEGQSYIVTGPRAISYHDIASELSNQLGRSIKYISTSLEEGYKSMMDAGMPGWLADDITALNKVYGENKATEVSHDVEKVTGNKPIGLNKFIADYLDSFK